MKKGTLLTLLLSLVMGVSSMALVGCGNKDNGDGGDNNNGGSGGNNGGSSVEQPSTPSTPAAPVLLSAATVSNGVKYTYTQTEFKDINGNLATFAELVDTQIDVLAQDILYRLAYVYGDNAGETNRQSVFSNNQDVDLYTIQLKNAGGTAYKYGNYNAQITNKSILTNYTNAVSSNETLSSLNITDSNIVSEFQKALLLNVANENYLSAPVAFNQVGAIDGYNMKLESQYGIMMLTTNADKSWVITNNDAYTDSSLSGIMSIKNSLKLGIAQVLANSSSTNYDTLINSINNIGYFSAHKNLLVNYIYNNIIGQNLVNKDNGYKQYIVDNYSGVIDASTRNGINSVTSLVDNSKQYTATDSPRLYKGYSIVVPAIVEQALANTFDGTTKSLYPKMSRTAVNVTTAPAGFTTAEQYETFTVMAKQGAKTTKMVLSFQGNGTTVGKTITVTYQIKAGTSSSTATKQVALNALATDVEFDLNSLLAGKTFGNYSGNTTAYTSNQAGVKADVNAEGQSLEYDNDNYVKFTVSGLNAGEKFVVKLNGIYDKV